ncbi:uncharacterized protein LOC129779890 [Toxorhynchites rutilus septentrionalis]|uniref:uncharacterized protein LOC129779890 n=1 Tax=Toxorhynchites rutilus septentrionalis TaxID=329112 RepID=UPI00247A10D4|nr:uncharacterized protein LOC129779890 [Toxorhynchites rutilus septentrionalis]
MSKSLAKKALALVEEGLLDSSKKSGPVKDKQQKGNGSELIPQHHKMVRSVGKKGHKESKEVLRRPKNLSVIEARKRIQNRKDNTEDNIRKLLLLSSANISNETSAKLFKRAQTGRYVVKADDIFEKEETEESVFNEEDFKNFEQELLST